MLLIWPYWYRATHLVLFVAHSKNHSCTEIKNLTVPPPHPTPVVNNLDSVSVSIEYQLRLGHFIDPTLQAIVSLLLKQRVSFSLSLASVVNDLHQRSVNSWGWLVRHVRIDSPSQFSSFSWNNYICYFQDYVMIAPSPKKKRLLTEHQKEIMCSRR